MVDATKVSSIKIKTEYTGESIQFLLELMVGLLNVPLFWVKTAQVNLR